MGATTPPPGFINQPVSSQSLSNNGSNKFDRYEAVAVSFDDGAGNIAAGTSSDSFLSQTATELIDEVVNEGANVVAENVVVEDAAANNDVNNDSSNIVAEPNTVSNDSSAVVAEEPKVKTANDYTSKELKELLQVNGIKLTNLKTKEQMFNKLKDTNLL